MCALVLFVLAYDFLFVLVLLVFCVLFFLLRGFVGFLVILVMSFHHYCFIRSWVCSSSVLRCMCYGFCGDSRGSLGWGLAIFSSADSRESVHVVFREAFFGCFTAG